MKKNSFFFILMAILVSLCTGFNAFGQTSSGYEQCNSLYTLLSRYDYFPRQQALLNNSSDNFPFNIIIDFASDSSSEETDSNKINSLIFAFKIQDAVENFQFILSMLDSIKASKISGNISIVFTYGDDEASQFTYLISGTQIFAENLEGENSAVIPVNFKSSSNTIIPGSGGDCSPAWLIQLISGALFDNGIKYVIRGGILSSLYRLRFLKDDFRTGMFMMNGIPSCGLDLCISGSNTEMQKKIVNFFSQICSTFDSDSTSEWDRHSRPVQFFNKTIILNESITIIIFILVSILSLFFLCEFSFLVKFTKKDVRKNVIRLWYLIPLSIILTTLAFMAEQGISFLLSKIIPVEPVSFTIFKLCAGFIIISFLYFAFIRIKGVYSTNVYSYLMTVTSVLNIFIFSAVDISLFYVFFAEYILINLTRPFKKTVSLIVIFFIVTIPFMPYLYQLLKFAEPEALNRILYMKFYQNLILSFGFLPLELIWLRLLTRLNIRWRLTNKKKKAFIKQNLITIGSAILLFIVILIVVVATIPDEYKVAEKKDVVEYLRASQEDVSVLYSDEDFYGDTIRTVSIKLSQKEENVSVSVKGKTSNPVLYSDELLQSEGDGKTLYFRLPAWSPENLTFNYIADQYDDSEITVQIRKKDPESAHIKIISRTVEIPAAKSGETD